VEEKIPGKYAKFIHNHTAIPDYSRALLRERDGLCSLPCLLTASPVPRDRKACLHLWLPMFVLDQFVRSVLLISAFRWIMCWLKNPYSEWSSYHHQTISFDLLSTILVDWRTHESRSLGNIFALGNVAHGYETFETQHQCNKYCKHYSLKPFSGGGNARNGQQS
jgi:hypothetical protein